MVIFVDTISVAGNIHLHVLARKKKKEKNHRELVLRPRVSIKLIHRENKSNVHKRVRGLLDEDLPWSGNAAVGVTRVANVFSRFTNSSVEPWRRSYATDDRHLHAATQSAHTTLEIRADAIQTRIRHRCMLGDKIRCKRCCDF